jgi:hypothetical protein
VAGRVKKKAGPRTGFFLTATGDYFFAASLLASAGGVAGAGVAGAGVAGAGVAAGAGAAAGGVAPVFGADLGSFLLQPASANAASTAMRSVRFIVVLLSKE